MSERKNLEKSTDKMSKRKNLEKSKKKRSENFSKKSVFFSLKIKQNKKFPPKNRFLVFFTPTHRSRIQINNRSL